LDELQIENVKANHTHLRTSHDKTYRKQEDKQEKIEARKAKPKQNAIYKKNGKEYELKAKQEK